VILTDREEYLGMSTNVSTTCHVLGLTGLTGGQKYLTSFVTQSLSPLSFLRGEKRLTRLISQPFGGFVS